MLFLKIKETYFNSKLILLGWNMFNFHLQDFKFRRSNLNFQIILGSF